MRGMCRPGYNVTYIGPARYTLYENYGSIIMLTDLTKNENYVLIQICVNKLIY